jgi:hypothetical protein
MIENHTELDNIPREYIYSYGEVEKLSIIDGSKIFAC